MKNFLAIDTSGDCLSVVARKNGETFSVFLSDCAMKHSVLLMEKIDEVLKKAALRPEECDFFAACVGAGSFTGIRIGISAAKGFALACDKPTLGVTSFELAAYNAVEAAGKTLCLVDALHDYYYACGYENGEVVLAPAYLSESEVLALMEEGYALRACATLPLARKAPVEIVSPVLGLERAVLALSEKNAFAPLEALYIRKSSAELNLNKGRSV